MTPEQRADVARRVAEMRKAQGLPPRITDPTVLARIAAIVTAGERRTA